MRTYTQRKSTCITQNSDKKMHHHGSGKKNKACFCHTISLGNTHSRTDSSSKHSKTTDKRNWVYRHGPKEKICTYSVLVYDTLTEQKTERYHVPVPYSVSKQVSITVRRCIVEQVQNVTTSQSSEIHSGDPKHVKKAA